MAREFFKNLPDTTTPLTAPRLNGLLDGDEAMGNIVVDSIRSKNLLNLIEQQITLTKSTTRTITITPNSRVVLKAGTYTISFADLVIANNNYPLYVEIIGLEIGGRELTNKKTTFTINEEKTITSLYVFLSSNDNNNATATFSKIQIEKGATATDYAPYQGIGYVSGSNANSNYIKYDDGTLIMFGSTTNNSYSSGIASVSFPYNLISTTTAFMFANENWGSANLGNNYFVTPQINSTSNGYIYVRDVNGNSIATNFKIAWLVIGRWK